mgnify:CR=1 FL=1
MHGWRLPHRWCFWPLCAPLLAFLTGLLAHALSPNSCLFKRRAVIRTVPYNLVTGGANVFYVLSAKRPARRKGPLNH